MDRPPLSLSEDLLTQLAAASHVRALSEKLFDVAAGGDLAGQLQKVLSAAREADVDALLRRQTAAQRLLGGDIEARMAFAVARKRAVYSLSESSRAAKETIGLVKILQNAESELRKDEQRLARVLAMAEEVAGRVIPPRTQEEFDLYERFERRRANLLSLRASTVLTLAQIPLAIAHNLELLERFNDVETVLFPVWERHAAALIQSPQDKKVVNAIHVAAEALITRLSEISQLPDGKAA